MVNSSNTTIGLAALIPAAPGFFALEIDDEKRDAAGLPLVWKTPIVAWHIETQRGPGVGPFEARSIPVTALGDDGNGALLFPDGSVNDCGDLYASVQEWLEVRPARAKREENVVSFTNLRPET
jgi:hypothetical protein